MGKATELVELLKTRPLTEEEKLRRNPYRAPELRLKPDEVVSVDHHQDPQVSSTLGRLATQEVGTVELRLADNPDLRAVLVPVEKYVALVGFKLAAESKHGRITPDGYQVPPELEDADVEQVDPSAHWQVHPLPGFPGS